MKSKMSDVTDGNLKESAFQFVECNINAYEFEETVNENLMVKYQVLKMDGSVMIWIGTKSTPKFCDLSLSMKTPYDSLPVTARVLGQSSDSPSVNLASKLTKKLNKPVYISFNLPADKFVLSDIEKRLLEEVKNNPQVF